jgi:hypothetical protein
LDAGVGEGSRIEGDGVTIDPSSEGMYQQEEGTSATAVVSNTTGVAEGSISPADASVDDSVESARISKRYLPKKATPTSSRLQNNSSQFPSPLSHFLFPSLPLHNPAVTECPSLRTGRSWKEVARPLQQRIHTQLLQLKAHVSASQAQAPPPSRQTQERRKGSKRMGRELVTLFSNYNSDTLTPELSFSNTTTVTFVHRNSLCR